MGKRAAIIGEIWISWGLWRYAVPLPSLCTERPKSKTNQKSQPKILLKNLRKNWWPGLGFSPNAGFSQQFLPKDLKVLFDTRARARAEAGSRSLLSSVQDEAPSLRAVHAAGLASPLMYKELRHLSALSDPVLYCVTYSKTILDFNYYLISM